MRCKKYIYNFWKCTKKTNCHVGLLWLTRACQGGGCIGGRVRSTTFRSRRNINLGEIVNRMKRGWECMWTCMCVCVCVCVGGGGGWDWVGMLGNWEIINQSRLDFRLLPLHSLGTHTLNSTSETGFLHSENTHASKPTDAILLYKRDTNAVEGKSKIWTGRTHPPSGFTGCSVYWSGMWRCCCCCTKTRICSTDMLN